MELGNFKFNELLHDVITVRDKLVSKSQKKDKKRNYVSPSKKSNKDTTDGQSLQSSLAIHTNHEEHTEVIKVDYGFT
jgi:hypothetical protein